MFGVVDGGGLFGCLRGSESGEREGGNLVVCGFWAKEVW